MNSTTIHETSIIHPDAEIGKNVSIGPYCVIGSQAVIADDVSLASHVTVNGRTRIGRKTQIWPFATLGSTPQDLKYKGEDTELIIGENNLIREYVNISIGTEGGGGQTVIGSNNLIMVYSHIAHDCILGDHCILANAANLGGHVVVGDRAVIGGVSAIHQFCHIGELAMIAGGSAVVQDVPPYCMVQGDRAKINGLNLVGLRRLGVSQETLNIIKNMYKILYRETLPLDEARARIRETIQDCAEKTAFLRFLDRSTRGVCR